MENIAPLRARHFLPFLRDVVCGPTGNCALPFLEAALRSIQNTAYHVNAAVVRAKARHDAVASSIFHSSVPSLPALVPAAARTLFKIPFTPLYSSSFP